MADPEHWQKHYIENGTTTGPVNGEQYFVEEQVKRKLQLVTLPNSWVTRWGDQDWTWQFNMTEKYREVTGNKWLYMDKEFHPDIKFLRSGPAPGLGSGLFQFLSVSMTRSF